MAGTDKRQIIDFGPAPTVVLVNPQLGENIGMAARAMANFGLFDLALVDPREGWDREKAVYATTARPRGMTKDVMTPEQAGLDMRARVSKGQKLAILFGRERTGLTNDEVSLADMIITAPVNPAYASLNIAQAVLLVGYEWFKHEAKSLGQATPELAALEGPGLQMPDTRPATKEELFGFFEHIEAELAEAGFFKSEGKRPGMVRNLRNLIARANPTEQEVRSLRGIVSSLTRTHERRSAARERT
jgi:tRNA/rRNA methyltransferase